MKKSNLLTRFFIIILSIMLMASSTGCGRNPDETVKIFFDSLQKQDIKAAASCLYNSKVTSFQNTEQEEVVKLIFSRLKYEIESTTVNKYTAKVKTKITSVDLTKVMSNMIASLLPSMIASSLKGQSSNASSTLVYQYLTKNISDPNAPTITSEIDINLIKDANTKKWVIVSDEDLANAMTGNFMKALSSFNQSVK